MEHVTQIMPAAPWVAVYTRPRPGAPNEEFRQEIPLVGWALTHPPALPRPGVRREQLLVGMIPDPSNRGVRLISQDEDGFRGYELPLSEDD